MIYTIGHSNYDIPEFLENAFGLDTIWDVRSHPGSTLSPQFNREQMRLWLPQAGLNYHWEPGLGGWDTRHKDVADRFLPHDVDVMAYTGGPKAFPKGHIAKKRKGMEEATVWRTYGLWDYSWFMTLDEFHEAASRLIEEGKKRAVGIVCVEAVWWRCHRSMIADYLAFMGVESIHIVGPRLTPHTQVWGNRLDRYDRIIIDNWERWVVK